MEDWITRAEHEEFRRNMEAEHKRLHRRLDAIEEATRQIGSLATSVERLAVSMENMAQEQKEQREKLDELESRDGELWRKIIGYIATAVIGVVLGAFFRQIGG